MGHPMKTWGKDFIMEDYRLKGMSGDSARNPMVWRAVVRLPWLIISIIDIQAIEHL